MKRNVLSSPRLSELKRHRRRFFLGKIFIFFLGLLMILVLLAYVSRLNNLNIAEIQIAGNKAIDTEAVKSTVEQKIAGKYLWLFPKTNILIYPQNTIKNELQDKFKRLKDINLSIKDNKILLVSVAEREAKYTWCGEMPALAEKKCYFLDEDGYIFDEAPYFSGEVYFKFYGLGGLTNPENPSGSYFDKSNFKQLISFKNNLADMSIKPTSLYLKDNGDVEIFLSPGKILPTGPQIILNKDSDFEKIAENLQAALTTEPLKSEFKNKYSSLLYIDLRFGNKVYYKFQ